MDPHRTAEALEHFRNGYLRFKSALHDRTTRFPSYPVLFDDLRTQLDARRRLGVVHVEPANLDLVESLYGWQVFDRTMAQFAAVIKKMPGAELPPGSMLAVGGVPADRFVAFIPELAGGAEPGHDDLAAIAAAVKVRLDALLEEDPFDSMAPRITVRVGHAFLSEDPFYRFERRVHAAVEEARTLVDRRERNRDQVWGAELRQLIRDERIRTVWQPVVEMASGSVFGFEALARGPKDSLFEMPRAMFALSGRVGASGDLDRLCRAQALRDGGHVAAGRKLFVNVLPSTLADPEWRHGVVSELLAASGRTPQDVVVEVSERAVGSGAELLAVACSGLREDGFAIALDDVGTARDGGEALDRLRPDYLKVDASVVRGIDRNLVKQEIFATIARQGEAVGAHVVAVGVESAEEAATLRALGTSYAQGYHYAGPAPRERWAP
jgi:EAL domain-containing protein (putative c-di-GMP-specific phosphodiesterase class I)/GGDEF domain-containing protein